MSIDVKDRPSTAVPHSEVKPTPRKDDLYLVFLSSTKEGFVWCGYSLYAPKACFEILTDIFQKVSGEDHKCLWEVYHNGISLVFNASYEIAEAKTQQANDLLDTRLQQYEPIKYFRFSYESNY
ncbi:MAG: hypothetical protein AAF988_04425 [Pseudomonadota bacterium]